MTFKWVFKNKFDVDGSPLKYKEILVSNIYSQVHGIDYIETFALVENMDSIRIALAIRASEQWEVTSHGCEVCFPKWRYH